KLSYRLHETGDGWRVFDVLVEGVSVVANYRAQFNQLLRSGSVDELLSRLEEKARAGESEKAKGSD
ncbi:MAG: ABC transporter substrate-binding protein, partial [Magnetococcales bacterium]|nr:ABC transporter substrate-binding protein [Magnetococcales bacterium]